MARLAHASGARLVLFDLGYPRAFTRAIEDEAGRLGVDYSPAGREALEAAREGRVASYLVDDGHWTAAGAEVVAGELARTIGEPAVAVPARP